ncbi:Digeranylgeranylglyceryl phosphate synthase [Methanosarcina siciliae C2J]|uniref:Digeranylgeranylglyceryl phosphate synthase n=3 Tax=Methanosarcina siciliae TaxID=38027 RepID=A0A0E3PAX6_9EURY|nr:prenyltransferase [Methanosarcina siciliae]AKB27422.1 Digeranylgeranylglyceryl phosphate synthase [Methanosarcina siciliae T4/M]AKB31364.1 Digeranylgeranylglyceryl phosphate synthase [Methanosarcina siciliae HI350]AKB35320.1 Digeranylgeranylglyceryl phosphate synthase [Methanosarcina siciliae C2J]
MKETLKAYLDLTRAHFFPAWPLVFCSGLVLAFANYGGFSWALILKASLIGLLGFEAGFVLNDYVDRNRDKLDVENTMTRYWRLFKERPIPSGKISSKNAFWLFILLAGVTSALIFTLPYPNSLCVFAIMLYSYGIEVFYQVKKRNQKYPVAQLLGRTDFTLFPAAGYLCYGQPDMTVLLYMVFFYPWTMAHLGLNDFIDLENDRARGMKSIAVLYGSKGAMYWVTGFTVLHFLASVFFLRELGTIALYGFLAAFVLLAGSNLYLWKEKSPGAGMKILPVYHGTLVIYAVSIILDFIY